MDTPYYIHGYGAVEAERLLAQAHSVADLLHVDTTFPAGSRVLEVGCGTGAQTIRLARNSPGARIVSIDRSAVSLAQARARVEQAAVTNVEFHELDLFNLPFEPASFDHAFVCFVLEHLPNPREALKVVSTFLRPGGTVTVFEGDHGSAYFHPHSDVAMRAVACQVELQRRGGGNACIGRQLYPLLKAAGYEGVRVSPRMVYVDANRPDLIEAFSRKTFTWMVEAVRDDAIAQGLITAAEFDAGIRDLYLTATDAGVFCYSFFKAMGTVMI
ncbi:MAG TPA: methyltransferase domain-containing protein [Gemmatimonadaceae bacterium]|nr:methyltransferase domain-containing protein [Gemmatimonadaceae bacterium]